MNKGEFFNKIRKMPLSELAISLMEDLQRCFQMLVILGDLSAKDRLSLAKAINKLEL